MGKIIVIIGNVSFENFSENELNLMKKNVHYSSEHKTALIRSISGLMVFDSIESAADAYKTLPTTDFIIPALWCGKDGNLLYFKDKETEDLVYKMYNKFGE